MASSVRRRWPVRRSTAATSRGEEARGGRAAVQAAAPASSGSRRPAAAPKGAKSVGGAGPAGPRGPALLSAARGGPVQRRRQRPFCRGRPTGARGSAAVLRSRVASGSAWRGDVASSAGDRRRLPRSPRRPGGVFWATAVAAPRGPSAGRAAVAAAQRLRRPPPLFSSCHGRAAAAHAVVVRPDDHAWPSSEVVRLQAGAHGACERRAIFFLSYCLLFMLCVYAMQCDVIQCNRHRFFHATTDRFLLATSSQLAVG